MRTVFAFPLTTLVATTSLLDELMPHGHGYWTDEELFIGLVSEHAGDLFGDWEPEDIHRVETALGYHPTWALQVDVSGRIDGTAEVRSLLSRLLEHGGVAVDDYSDHCWTLRELENGVRIEGLAFFDFRGHYEKHYQT